MACEGYLRRTRQPDVLSRTIPVYSQLAAAHADVHFLVELTPAPAHRDRRAGARTAGQRLAGPALMDPKTDVRAIDDLHEARVDAPGKTGVTLDRRAQALHGRRLHRLHREDRMRIADRHRADLDPVTGGLEGVALRLRLGIERQRARIEADRSHVHGYPAPLQNARPDQAGGTVHRDRARVRQAAPREKRGDASDAV